MAVVYDARLGGHAVSLIGIESRPLPRHGVTPADGPAQWSAGTLFPLSSKKVARAINAASGCRPVVDARQPVRLRRLAGVAAPPAARVRRRDRPGDRQLRRAVRAVRRLALPRRRVRRVLGDAQRRHGGARRRGLVRLGDRRRAGGRGGVHPRRRRPHPRRRTRAGAARRPSPTPRRTRSVSGRPSWRRRATTVRTEKLGEVAAEFDAVHSVQRAQAVGSVHRIIAAATSARSSSPRSSAGMHRVDAT